MMKLRVCIASVAMATVAMTVLLVGSPKGAAKAQQRGGSR